MAVELFDTHAHLNFDGYTEEDRRRVAQAVGESEIAHLVDTAYDLPSSRMAADHAARYPWCLAAVGLHPLYAPEAEEGAMAMAEDEFLSELREITRLPGVVAIGEIGLHYREGGGGGARRRKIHPAGTSSSSKSGSACKSARRCAGGCPSPSTTSARAATRWTS